ncbi:Gmad2 immunoglobulin-like domain-containing protein [Nocardioides daeguensis]|uniref:Bacterial spore germination immunoglobulin-like domain-containing protein n=1 Tax=Nocardioides daeguensis TaxID=908359 RepID=A0ABP6VPK8_9ACTN|nr:Gmad2 immunoglobulin-like domain-containing protein [Nocardioides daeguensis]MBV6727441.1 GerMN domain-containing protein [Nocardioides daeguensis]MCR1775531.1 GerMN domain-containing protein [Nocardioides daeguensis]
MSLPRTLSAVGAVLALGALAGCGDDERTTQETPSPAPSTAATPSPSEEPAPEQTVWAYFVGDTPHGAALYAEVHVVPAVGDSATVLQQAPADPDYRTLVPPGSLLPKVHFDGTGEDGSFSVELTDASWTERPDGMSAKDAELAVQQLVWTVQSSPLPEGSAEPVRTAAPVDFYLDGKEVSYLGVPSGAAAQPELDVLAGVNVTEPAEGTAVGDTFTATGRASSFEATVPWEVQDSSGKVVLDGFATAEGWIDKLYPWTSEVDVSELPAGTYTFVARTDDPSGGEGGGPTEDTKRITVR